VPQTLPDGDAAPRDGALPAQALDGLGGRPFGFYVHVPFCAVRCGYCDFNTYTAQELGSGKGASRESYADAAIAEIRLARRVLGDRQLPVDTVFLGGGTPTVLAAEDLVRVVAVIREEFGMVPGAEVTAESNPDSVDLAALRTLACGGFNRVSFGVQSVRQHVLDALDRTHDPARVPRVVSWARRAGIQQINLDLIYGTPGESLADWEASLEAAIALRPDHLSAYSLIVEPGTALARRISRGELPMTDEDNMADKYQIADLMLEEAGFGWYEVSNWSRGLQSRSRHNLSYWTGADWWGVGPGAHSHVNGTRWWNVKHPAAYATRIDAGESPAAGRELLTRESRRVERVMLGVRLADGLALEALDADGVRVAGQVAERGLIDAGGLAAGRVVLTAKGRLLADAVVRELLPQVGSLTR
jgi:putative oxygen-independent coproporphyrinogen III oxidase